MNDEVKKHQREWLVQMLRSQVCEVIFEKADGSERKMICTLKKELLPKQPTTNINQTTKQPNYITSRDNRILCWRDSRRN